MKSCAAHPKKMELQPRTPAQPTIALFLLLSVSESVFEGKVAARDQWCAATEASPLHARRHISTNDGTQGRVRFGVLGVGFIAGGLEDVRGGRGVAVRRAALTVGGGRCWRGKVATS
jgi:hypothetical protein